ncbi:MAG: ferritin-like domain-containing protein [Xenococcaceae cyanobacterium]
MKKLYEIPLEALVRRLATTSDQTAATALNLEESSIDLEPKRQPRDEAALLLTVGAEVEHALMVQYLYAAYSVRYDQPNDELKGQVRGLQMRLVQIAREEMGHLMTVQNLLHLIGAPLNFEREHSPFESEFYPFRFKLQKLTRHSLAKYVTAERPADISHLPQEQREMLEQIARQAQCDNDGYPIKHVGPIYKRLIELFENELEDEDFRTDTTELQAKWRDWGYDESLLNTKKDDYRKVYVDNFEGYDPSRLRQLAVEALQTIDKQGEGYSDCTNSHFQRFFQLYKDFVELEQQGVDFVWPVATNPSTSKPPSRSQGNCYSFEAARAAFEETGYIADERSRNWGHLFNFRYGLLLAFLTHFLRVKGSSYVANGPDQGDRTPRGLLLLWTFDEMRQVKKIADKMVQLPLCKPYKGINAGPPFQLPYTLALPDEDRARWRTHLDVVSASLKLVRDNLRAPSAPDEADPFLEDLQAADEKRVQILRALAQGKSIPPETQPKDFQKVAHILEEAVRGFGIDVHTNFWAGINRDQFVGLHMFNRDFILRDDKGKGEDKCKFKAEGSELVSRLENPTKAGTMPRYRPHVDPSRQQFVRDWIDAQAPDNDPPGQIGVKHEGNPLPEAVGQPFHQAVVSTLGYAADIRPLFRDFDVETLKQLDDVDLDNLVSVRANVEALQQRLESGTLPYDASWSPDRIDLFCRWVESGMRD